MNWSGGSFAYSCTWPTNGLAGAGNTDADPLLVSGGFTLQATSPCIDAGTNKTWMIGATDLAGNARKIDGDNDTVATVDMGAYEALEPPPAGTIFLLR